MKNTHPLVSLLIAIVFLLGIYGPALDKIFGLDNSPELTERRKLAERPVLDLDDIPGFAPRFNAYVNDHFGFRKSLIRLYNRILITFFQQAGHPMVVIGKNGWMFINLEKTVEDYRRIEHFEKKDLKKWAKELELKRLLLESRGIKYLFVIPPNKITVCGPRYMPDRYTVMDRETKREQLVQYLKTSTRVRVLDLTSSLLKASEIEDRDIYFHTDTHWNPLGAWYGYWGIIQEVKRWFPQVPTISKEALEVRTIKAAGGDLAEMVGLERSIEETSVELHYEKGYRAGKTVLDNKMGDTFVMRTFDNTLPKALVFRDSFMFWMVDYLSESFNSTTYVWPDRRTVIPILPQLARWNPDIVIEEVGERLLNYVPVRDNDLVRTVFDEVGKTVFKFNPLMPSGGFDIVHEMELIPFNGGMKADISNRDPQLLLTLTRPPRTGLVIIKVVIESEDDGVLQIFLDGKGSYSFTEENSIQLHIKRGSNEIFLPVESDKIGPDLRFDPTDSPGLVRIRHFEIRDTG